MNFGAMVAYRLRQETEAFTRAATHELGLPVSFVREQIAYATHCLADLNVDAQKGHACPEVSILFPGNTEGAMPAYLLSLAVAMGVGRIHTKLSRRCPGIQACLESVFAGVDRVCFHTGRGEAFLAAMLSESNVRLIQVFGDDAWIGAYEDQVRMSGKTVLFDGPGKDPFIVLQGADLDRSVRGAVASGLFAGGAACMSAERFLVQEDIFEVFVEKLVQQLAPIRPLPPTQPDAILGYLHSDHVALRLQAQIDDAVRAGAHEILHSRIQRVEFAGRSWYACAPAVIRDVHPGSRILTEETFGPVFPLQSFQTLAECLAMAEDCAYGLTATVFGPQGKANMLADELRSSHAIVYVNQMMLNGFNPDYWGSGGFKRSGWVWETGPDGIFRVRSGFRPLRGELARIMARLSEEGRV